MGKVNVTIRMDKELKKEADEILDELGMSFTTAVTLFIKQCVRDREFPFEPMLEPNKTTIKALKELDRMIKHPEEYKTYNSFKEILEELEAEKKSKKDQK